MIFSKTAISVVCVLLLLSIFMANLLNIIATDHKFYSENEREGENFTKHIGEKYGRITDSTKHLIWFLQVSKIKCLSKVKILLTQRQYFISRF